MALTLLLAACNGPAPKPAEDVHFYTAQGVIQKISDDRHVATIQHDAIPGYMMAMTMDFSVRDPSVLTGLARGDKVMFTLEVTKTDAWIITAQRLGHTDLAATNAPPAVAAAPELKVGDLVPDAELIDENGHHLHLSDFRGKAVALTFFFTRCPLPNFCPLMNRNFAATRELLLDKTSTKNWEFLSVSFDPEHDTPQALADNAKLYRHHTKDRWLFTVTTPEALNQLAPALGLIVMRSGDSISHNLRTVVIDPQGRLFQQFNDNTWTPTQLARAILTAAKKK